jgi:two-component system sensor histidine kinase/response regulator
MQTILVIEDEEAVRANILELLEAEDFEALAAENGEIGVQLAQQHIPDLIICDVRMPGMDGYEVLKRVREDAATAAIPFIFLTAHSDKTDLRRGMELGADDYLTKPCTPTELLQAIAARLTKQLVVKHLQQQVRQLQDLSLSKDDLLCNASHDLRAPLANIKIAIQLLKTTTDEEQRNRYLNLLERECNHETALLNDLLDLQRLEANAYFVELQPLSLHTWIPYVVESFESRLQESRQTLRVDVASNLPLLTSDPTSLRRILTELLNNACKYTPSGGKIILSVRHDASHATSLNSAPEFTFTVANQGEISANDIPHIFEKFYRVSRINTTRQTGTGLGLALVHKLVEHLEGTIQARSGDGWTTFIVQLPAKLTAT